MFDERLGRAGDFSNKAGVVHSEILLPDGAPAHLADRAALWNAVEAREARKAAQLAGELEIALPRELSQVEGIRLARDFVTEQFVSRGMIADLNVHWGETADGERQPHVHVMLTMRDLDEPSDALHFLAGRAMAYWLRVIWWKTGFHMINRLLSVARAGRFDGGALINTKSGTEFYTPRVGRTIVMRPQPIMRAAQWSEIAEALNAGEEAAAWHDYLTSAHQRIEAGDRLAAMLDLAVAVEARIRTFPGTKLPSGIANGFRRAIRRQNISDVFAHWQAYELPDFPDLACLKTLFEIRNGIMHNGREERADVAFFKAAAKAVRQRLVTLQARNSGYLYQNHPLDRQGHLMQNSDA